MSNVDLTSKDLFKDIGPNCLGTLKEQIDFQYEYGDVQHTVPILVFHYCKSSGEDYSTLFVICCPTGLLAHKIENDARVNSFGSSILFDLARFISTKIKEVCSDKGLSITLDRSNGSVEQYCFVEGNI